MRLIDADALKDWSEIVPLTGDGGIDINDFDEKLKSMPTVDAVPVRHGKWIDITESHIGTCSLCGDRWGSVDMMNYCPNCGARMEEERGSDHAEEEIL